MTRIRILIILLVVTNSLIAQNEKSDDQKPIPNPEISTTQQRVTINGKTISLTAKAGTMTLRDENNDPIALFGFTSYTKSGAEHNRPIMFAYNGGPGSSSFWLHMGVLGPKRIPVNDGGYTPASPYALENNNFSILDIADLVMIDPVGTGLTVPVGKAEFKDNIIMKYYEAGHMMYTNQPSLEKFKEDVGEFIKLCNGQLVNIRP